MRSRLLAVLCSCPLIFAGVRGIAAQAPSPEASVARRALQEFRDGNFRAAERDLRELTRRNPLDIVAHVMLGNSLFRQEKYSEAVAPYEKARELDARARVLNLDQRRVLGDQLAMAYGLSGQLEKAIALLNGLIQRDPEYALNYYNLACAYAESGDEDKMLANLSLAIKHREHMIKGEQLPDPRADPSFEKYLHEERFVKLMKDSGYK